MTDYNDPQVDHVAADLNAWERRDAERWKKQSQAVQEKLDKVNFMLEQEGLAADHR